MLRTEPRVNRYGRPVRVLAWSDGKRDRVTAERLTDFEVSYWYRVLLARGQPFDLIGLLRAECERSGLSTDPADLPGQRTLF